MPTKFTPVGELLRPCVGREWAMGAFDTMSLEMTQGIVDAAIAERSPLIIMVLPGYMRTSAWPGLLACIETEIARAGLPVGVHFDHCTTIDQVVEGLRLGISGAMIDGSKLPLEQNIALTRAVVELCHEGGVFVEAELGHVGQSTEELSDEDASSRLTRVDEAVRFVAETGVDALAVSVGNVHGLYRGRPHIDFARLAALRAALDIPLVMHGGSDTPEDDLRRAIATGLDKINIWTDVRVAYLDTLKRYLAGAQTDRVPIEDMIADAREVVCTVTRAKMRLFGSSGRA
jgi:fructose-bisphosphate aldolase, class II